MTGVLAYIERMIPVMLAALPVWAALRGIFLILKKQRFYWKQELLMTAFVVWCAGLASQTMLPSNGYFIPWSSVGSWRTAMRINLVPFRTILQYFTRGNITLLLVNFVGNIVVFIPLGAVSAAPLASVEDLARCDAAGTMFALRGIYADFYRPQRRCGRFDFERLGRLSRLADGAGTAAPAHEKTDPRMMCRGKNYKQSGAV